MQAHVVQQCKEQQQLLVTGESCSAALLINQLSVGGHVKTCIGNLKSGADLFRKTAQLYVYVFITKCRDPLVLSILLGTSQ